MGKRLPVPPELEHLIEKRESEGERRQRDNDRRGDDDLGPLGAIESTADLQDVPTDNRRENGHRRKKKDRRAGSGRKRDS